MFSRAPKFPQHILELRVQLARKELKQRVVESPYALHSKVNVNMQEKQGYMPNMSLINNVTFLRDVICLIDLWHRWIIVDFSGI